MCMGISISRRDIPDTLIERYALHDRIVTRTPKTEPEVHFHYRNRTPLIPVWHGAELKILLWGNPGQSRLPRGGWCHLEWLEGGHWGHLCPEPVEIHAMLGFERGIWFLVNEGIKGVMVKDERGQDRVYMLTQPASHYYHVMTRSLRMPVMVGENI